MYNANSKSWDKTYDALKVAEPYCEDLTTSLGTVLTAPVNIVNNLSVDLGNGNYSNIPSGIWGAITGARQIPTIDVIMSQESQAQLYDNNEFLYQTISAATTLIDPLVMFSGVKAYSASTKVAGATNKMVLTMDDDIVKLMSNTGDDVANGTSKTVNAAIEVKDGVRYINGNKAIINAEKQARHLPDTVQGARSYLTADAQKLLDKVGGTGDFVQPKKEVVNVGSNIGKYVDQATGVAVDTARVTIHYSKTGVHIVPAPPLK